MLVFLTVPKKGEEAFGMGSCSQIITPEGYLVPVNVTRDQEAAIYGGKKLEEYTDLVMRYYEEEEKEGFRLSEKWEVYREKGRALEELYTYAPEKLLEEADETEKMGYYTFEKYCDIPYSSLPRQYADHDCCVVIRVPEGLEGSLYQQGARPEDVWKQLKKHPFLIWKADGKKIRVEAERYLYDKSERYQKEFLLNLEGNTADGTLRVYSGMRLVLFLKEAEDGSYYQKDGYSYFITEEGELVSAFWGQGAECDFYSGRPFTDYTQQVERIGKEDCETENLLLQKGIPWDLSVFEQGIYGHIEALPQIQKEKKVALAEEEYPAAFQRGQSLEAVLEILHKGTPFSEILAGMGYSGKEELLADNRDLGIVRGGSIAGFYECDVSLSDRSAEFERNDNYWILELYYHGMEQDKIVSFCFTGSEKLRLEQIMVQVK